MLLNSVVLWYTFGLYNQHTHTRTKVRTFIMGYNFKSGYFMVYWHRRLRNLLIYILKPHIPSEIINWPRLTSIYEKWRTLKSCKWTILPGDKSESKHCHARKLKIPRWIYRARCSYQQGWIPAPIWMGMVYRGEVIIRIDNGHVW